MKRLECAKIYYVHSRTNLFRRKRDSEPSVKLRDGPTAAQVKHPKQVLQQRLPHAKFYLVKLIDNKGGKDIEFE